MSYQRGVFCLEGDWHGIRDASTVEPVLDLLNGACGLPFIHRDVGTLAEFEYYLGKWAQRGMSDHPILYLGFHGDPGVIYIGDLRRREGEVTFDKLEELLANKCRGRVIHFGSCGTLDEHGARLNRFLRTTKAVAVCGYKTAIDWVLSSAFDIIVLNELSDRALTRRGARVAEKRIRAKAGTLARKLHFRMHHAP